MVQKNKSFIVQKRRSASKNSQGMVSLKKVKTPRPPKRKSRKKANRKITNIIMLITAAGAIAEVIDLVRSEPATVEQEKVNELESRVGKQENLNQQQSDYISYLNGRLDQFSFDQGRISYQRQNPEKTTSLPADENATSRSDEPTGQKEHISYLPPSENSYRSVFGQIGAIILLTHKSYYPGLIGKLRVRCIVDVTGELVDSKVENLDANHDPEVLSFAMRIQNQMRGLKVAPSSSPFVFDQVYRVEPYPQAPKPPK